MRLLFDHNVPAPFRRDLPNHAITLAVEQGWHGLKNGELLTVAEAAGFEVLVTVDKKLRYQQNLAGRKIGVAILPTQDLAVLRAALPQIETTIEAAALGGYRELTLPYKPLVRRLPPEPYR